MIRTFRSTLLMVFQDRGEKVVAETMSSSLTYAIFGVNRSIEVHWKVVVLKKCTRRPARVRVKNVCFYRDGPWEKFDGNDTSVRPSSRAFGLSHSLSISVSVYIRISLARIFSLFLSFAHTQHYNIVMYAHRSRRSREIRSNIILCSRKIII